LNGFAGNGGVGLMACGGRAAGTKDGVPWAFE
jgi:hypothetical protein